MISLSLCMIIKDEEAVIKRLLDNIKDIFDEIVIVDTGSTDKTLEIIKNYNIQLYHFEWCDDFSKARNFSFSKATKDYIMWLDADDLIDSLNLEKLINLKNSLDSNIDVVMMKYATNFDSDSKPTFLFYRERLLKNNKNFTWIGEVHEVIQYSGKIIYSDVTINHDKLKDYDSARNLRIYQNKINNKIKLSARDKYYYAKELFYHKEFDKSITTFLDFLEEKDKFIENVTDAYLTMSNIYIQQKKDSMALRVLFESFNYKLPNAEICCQIGLIYYTQSQFKESIFYYKLALEDSFNLAKGAFVNTLYYDFVPLLQLCHISYKIGDISSSLIYHKKLLELYPSNNLVISNNEIFAKENLL